MTAPNNPLITDERITTTHTPIVLYVPHPNKIRNAEKTSIDNNHEIYVTRVMSLIVGWVTNDHIPKKVTTSGITISKNVRTIVSRNPAVL